MPLTLFEFAEIIGVPQISMLVYSRICPANTFLEFLFYSVPQYLVLRFIERAYLVYLALITVLLVVPTKYHRTYTTHTDPIDRMRMTISFLVCLAIFAADFKNYDSGRFGKSMNCEFRLMDVGAGSFVFNSGLVSFKASRQKKLINSGKCFFFGICRLLSKILLRVDIKEAEFGKHFNFFIDLALLNLISIFVNPQFPYVSGLVLIFWYQIALFLGLEAKILNNDRKNFFTANLEGIVFLVPQFGTYLMSQEIGKSVVMDKSMKKVVMYFMASVALFCGTYFYEPVARRLHNAPYCLLMHVSHTAIIICFDFLNIHFKIGELKVSTFGSKNMLNILIISNVLVQAARYIGYFEESSDIKVAIKIQIYLFIIFYLIFKIQGSLKSQAAAKVEASTDAKPVGSNESIKA
ncbi:uncharacterized protein VICG_01091 [Vittaforma corneae ATCC 50505]|uniref:GPI-anchored wall transfer protein n=1 Tax=Vittaforma corneae (strain ATCC 50505) TaxID=993615 RepID=L2GNL0_VITCO|nr:uncharacterized protein VICG_01091 [Vittaforma corneae ATCC 50505]ELA41907.1 hypothetical protein VICG_01091 [Vittaforma corneae ATCC 50505]